MGQYNVKGYLGQGGLGIVMEGRHKLTNRPVAIKILNEFSGEPNIEERFQREAEAAMRLNHPNVVTTYEYGIEDGRSYLVMELLHGKRLSDLMENDEQIDYTKVIDLFAQLADGMAAAHAAGILHRDIKPGNIMVVREPDGSPKPKLIDFGLSKLLTAEHKSLTATGQVVGTPAYMSPEQCLGQDLDARSDIYSLGCVMYEFLTGNAPVSGTGMEAMFQHVSVDPDFNCKTQAVPGPLKEIVLKALEKKREVRYQSMSELRAALQSIRGRDLSKPSIRSSLRLNLRNLRKIFDVRTVIAICAIVFVSSIVALLDTTRLTEHTQSELVSKPVGQGMTVRDPNSIANLQLLPPTSGPESTMLGTAMNYLDNSRYDPLDAMFSAWQNDKFEYTDGRRKIDRLEHSLAVLPVSSGPQGQYWLDKLNGWTKAYPQSAGAKLVLADALCSVAWAQQNRAWCELNAEEKLELNGALKEAKELWSQAKRLDPSSPVLASVRLRIALLESMPRSEYDSLYCDLQQLFPDYKMLAFQRAVYLEKTWHGAPGEWEQFAKTAAENNPEMYAQICWYALSARSKFDAIDSSALSWTTLQAGFERLISSQVSGLAAASEYCNLAFAFGDDTTARKLFKTQIKNRVDLSVWTVPEYMAAFDWAAQ